jgi:site-specific recombinase XerD
VLLRNPNTRNAYGRAIAEFCRWCGSHQIALPSLSSLIVGAYFNELAQRLSPASANQHLSGIRRRLATGPCGIGGEHAERVSHSRAP